MNREIKFRAWHKENKNMLKAVSVDTRKKETNTITPLQYRGTRYSYNDFGRVILMQFTGLKDKNGKEIFEGDVVKYKNSIWKVRFEFGGFDLFADAKNLSEAIVEKPKTDNEMIADELNVWWTRCEVLGNIYENPELLEDQNVN